MRRLLILFTALSTVSASSGAQATGTTVTPRPRGAGMEVRQYTLQVLSGAEGVSLLTPFVPFEDGGGVWRSSGSVISVVGNKRTLAIVDSVLKSYDHAPATLVFRFMLIAATDSAVSDPRIGEIDVELRRLLKFNGYRRLAEATSVVSEGASFTSTMSSTDSGEFTIDGGVKSVRDGRVGLVIQLRSEATGRMMDLQTSTSSRRLLSTMLTVPLGQTVVLGTAAGDKGVAALILTVRPELAAGQATVPAVGIAISPTRATKTVDNPPRDGTSTYKFTVFHLGSANFDGILRVHGDSVTVESRYVLCRPDVPGKRGFFYIFRCVGMQGVEDVALHFDVHDLRNASGWRGFVSKAKVVGRQCVQYSTDPNQKGVIEANRCIRWEPIEEVVKTSVGGGILIGPAPP